MSENKPNRYIRTIIWLFVPCVFFVILGYWVGKQWATWDFLEKKTTITNEIQLIQAIAEAAVLEYHDVAVKDFDNSTQVYLSDNALTQWWKKANNSLNYKHIRISIPIIAKYGVALKDSNMLAKSSGDTIFIQTPKASLLSLELNLAEKQVISEKGWFVFSDNKALEPVEKFLYDRERQRLASDEKMLTQATQSFQEKLVTLYKGLGKTVIWH